MSTLVKICGLTNAADALAAAKMGADMLGFVLAPSPRQITPEQLQEITGQLPSGVLTVGVFVNESPAVMRQVKSQCGLDLLQLHGDEDQAFAAALGPGVIKALSVSKDRPPDPESYPGCTLLLDTYDKKLRGGSGRTFDWSLAVQAARQRKIILAGGLHADNVAQAIEQVRPFAVDIASGVEREPGRKDHDKMASFIQRAKSAA